MPRLFALAAALAPFAVLGVAGSAEDATPGAAGACVHRELPPGTPTPREETAITAGSPAAGEAEVTTDSVAEGTALPPAMPDPNEGTPADQETVDRVLTFERNLFACFNTGNYLGVAALHTPEALVENFGTGNAYDVPAILAGAPPIELIGVDDVRVLPDGRIRYQDAYRVGDEIYRDVTYLVERDGFLLVAKTVPLAREPATEATPAGSS